MIRVTCKGVLIMFVIRSKSGMVFTSTEWGENNGKEIEYATQAEAEKEIEIYQQSFRDQEFFVHELNAVGRPPIGITKKVSLTLSEENWELFDEKADGNRSKFLRGIVGENLAYEIGEPITVKPTFISYCAECKKDFREGETCHFTWYENNVFCHDCKEIMNSRVTESYLEWQLRVHIK